MQNEVLIFVESLAQNPRIFHREKKDTGGIRFAAHRGKKSQNPTLFDTKNERPQIAIALIIVKGIIFSVSQLIAIEQ